MKRKLLLAAPMVCGLMSPSVHASLVGEETKLTASDASSGDDFGLSVAISSDTAIIGAPLNDDAGAQSGSAYIFERDVDGGWSEVTKLIASDASLTDQFGFSVAIRGDTAIVGAPKNSSGAAYISKRNASGVWGEVTKLIGIGDFGWSVAISGNTAIVGAPLNDDAGANSGAAYIFGRNAGGVDNWGQVAILTASDAVAQDRFGWSVAISGDMAIVGAPFDDDAGEDSGAVYIFERDAGGVDNWGEMIILSASDAFPADRFGWSVAISGDTAIVGAPDKGGPQDFGGAYVLQRDVGGLDNWGEVAVLTGSDVDTFDEFGRSVAITEDKAAVGVPFKTAEFGDGTFLTFAGAAYVFERDVGGANNWGEVTKLTASDASNQDRFGWSVAISGHAIIAGAPEDNGGSAYVFEPSDSDGDGVADILDNCIFEPNGPLIPDAGDNIQLDSDGDGYGNLCDGDLDNDGVVSTPDLVIFRGVLFTQEGDPDFNEDADFDGDGTVSTPDLVRFRGMLFTEPGPSGLVP